MPRLRATDRFVQPVRASPNRSRRGELEAKKTKRNERPDTKTVEKGKRRARRRRGCWSRRREKKKGERGGRSNRMSQVVSPTDEEEDVMWSFLSCKQHQRGTTGSAGGSHRRWTLVTG